jgi:hypothetical protein
MIPMLPITDPILQFTALVTAMLLVQLMLERVYLPRACSCSGGASAERADGGRFRNYKNPEAQCLPGFRYGIGTAGFEPATP